MNGDVKEYIEVTSELTARRIIEKMLEKLPCEKHVERLEKMETRIGGTEHAMIQQYDDIHEAKETAEVSCTTAKEVQKAVNGLWWKVFIAVVIPMAVFLLVTKWT